MAFGVVEYDSNGRPVCEVCGKSFHRVLAHVRQKHDMSEREYKKKYGFDIKKGICSKESREIARARILANFHVIQENLLKKGKPSRFKKGAKGRTRDQVSEQTRLFLHERLKTPKMVEILKKSGRRVGLSGLGNEKRWGKRKA